jgi:hypothetical protein
MKKKESKKIFNPYVGQEKRQERNVGDINVNRMSKGKMANA